MRHWTAEDVGPYKFWHMPFVSSMDGRAAITDIFGRGDPSPTAFPYFSFVGEAFRLPLFDLYHCSVNIQTRGIDRYLGRFVKRPYGVDIILLFRQHSNAR